MKKLFLLLALIVTTNAFAESEFLPGRIVSRTASRTILAKCTMQDEAKACIGFQFYYSDSGNEADAVKISNRTYTEKSMKELLDRPVLFNAMREDREGLNVVGYVEFLNDYDDSWGESVFARVAYAIGRGFCYGVITPIIAAVDVAGVAISTPRTIVTAAAIGMSNQKIRKLMRAVRTGKTLPMNIERVYRLRDSL